MMLVISSSPKRSRMAWKASAAGLAEVHVGQHAAELRGDRMPLELLDGLLQRADERRARLHQQRQQIQQERHAAFDLAEPPIVPGPPVAAAAARR